MTAAKPIWASAFRAVDASDDPGTLVRYLDAGGDTLLAKPKRQAIAVLGLRPGDSALDIGCGTGNDVRAMARLVGPSGRSVGVDASRAMVAEAHARTREPQDCTEFHVADAHRLPFADDSFDAVRVERTLQHVADPARVIAEMVRVARPGAILTASEPDWDTLVIDVPPLEVTRAICRSCADALRQPDIGRRLRGLFLAAGAESVQLGTSAPAIVDLALAESFMQLSVFAHRAAAGGALTRPAARAWVREVRERDRQGRFYATVNGFIVVARASSTEPAGSSDPAPAASPAP